MELNKIYHGDCLETMKQLPDKSIDLILTDPPYGIGESGKTNHSRSKIATSKHYKDFGWDNKRIEKAYFDEMFRVAKNQIIFGGNYYTDYLQPSPCWIVWDKNNGDNDFADCELAWTSFKTAVRKYKYTWHGMLQENMKQKEKRHHPTQKPVSLFMWILENYSQKGETILDPFLGSGTTALAAINTGRFFVGIEKQREYVDVAKQRVDEAQSQIKMFI